MAFRIARYAHTRFWALWEDDELVCVTVYKKGALAVQQRLAAAPRAAGEAAARQARALATQARGRARRVQQAAQARAR